MKNFIAIVILFFITAVCTAQNKVDGLELPVSCTLDASKKTHKIDAKCKGVVKWFVASTQKTTYKIDESKNSIDINLPASGNVQVVAVGVTDSGVTTFATTTISIKKEDIKLPVIPIQKNTILIFTDISKLTNQELDNFDKLYYNQKINFIVNDITSPLLLQTKYNELYQNLDKKPMIIVEDSEGKIQLSGVVPKNDKELNEIINKYSF